MGEKITYEDIRKGVQFLHERGKPWIKKKFDWGWIWTDQFGNPKKIKLNRNQISEFKKIMKMNYRYGRNTKEEMIIPWKLKTIDGLQVLNRIDMSKN